MNGHICDTVTECYSVIVQHKMKHPKKLETIVAFEIIGEIRNIAKELLLENLMSKLKKTGAQSSLRDHIVAELHGVCRKQCDGI